MTENIKIKSKLAGNPSREPLLKTTIFDEDQKNLAVADPVATRALISLMDMYAVLGGAASHYGGPAALAELMSAAHGLMFSRAQKVSKPWHELFHFVNDAGHCENGLYALKANYGFAGLKLEDLKKFRSIESPLTGHGEAHCWPEGVYLSNGPLGSAFPQSQGLAMAEACSAKPRTTLAVISDGALMEGEAKEAIASIPGFAALGKLGPYVLIISDNNTKLSGRIDKDCFPMKPTMESFQTLGWKVISLKEGHDLQKCFNTIADAVKEAEANPKAPIVIHANTIKGIGTKKTADSASGGHGFPLKSPKELPEFLSEIYSGKPTPEFFQEWIKELLEIEKNLKADSAGQKIQVGVANALIKSRKDGLPVISITSDLPGSTGLAAFRKEFPTDSWDVGIAESNMVSVAAGFSKQGFIPVVDTFAQFGVTKGALPLTMASLSEAPIIGIFSHTGFQDAADGASHQALSYLAMVSSIPHVDVYCLSCSDEAEALVSEAIQNFAKARQTGKVPHSSIFFLGRENFPKSYLADAKYSLAKGQVLADQDGSAAKSVVIATNGSLVGYALKAAETLTASGISASVLNLPCVNHLDGEALASQLSKAKGRIVTVDDHQVQGGLGSMIAHWGAQKGIAMKMKSLGVQSEFGQSAYTSHDLYVKHRMDSAAIINAAKELQS